VDPPSRGGHGSLTGGTRIRDGGMTPSRRCRELRSSSRVVQHRRTRCVDCPCHRTGNPRSAFQALVSALERSSQGRKCDAPGISVTDRAYVWRLPDRIVTEVRPPPVPVTPPPTKASRPGRLMGVTACQDPHEAPRTTSDGRPTRPGSISDGRHETARDTHLGRRRRSRTHALRRIGHLRGRWEQDRPCEVLQRVIVSGTPAPIRLASQVMLPRPRRTQPWDTAVPGMPER